MFPNSLDKKPLYTRPDGVKIKDLTNSMFNMKTGNYISYTVYKVPKEYEMRPDLISGAVYNNSQYTELILKYNGISNPFTIKEGDIILIPNLDSMKVIVAKASGSDVNGAKAIRNSYKYIDPTKIPKNADSNYQNRPIAAENLLPSNIAEEGETQITYRNGRVYFGSSVDTCFENGQTSSEFLVNVIRSKSK
jgi:hypothetical protein